MKFEYKLGENQGKNDDSAQIDLFPSMVDWGFQKKRGERQFACTAIC
jgi:hypothetical protein